MRRTLVTDVWILIIVIVSFPFFILWFYLCSFLNTTKNIQSFSNKQTLTAPSFLQSNSRIFPPWMPFSLSSDFWWHQQVFKYPDEWKREVSSVTRPLFLSVCLSVRLPHSSTCCRSFFTPSPPSVSSQVSLKLRIHRDSDPSAGFTFIMFVASR